MLSSLKNIKQLRWVLVVFFMAIAIPALVLSFYSYRQLKWESFYLQRNNATELSERINSQIERWMLEEENRSFTDYRFLKLAGDEAANYFTPSPLSSFPSAIELPGVIGFFQLDSQGLLTSPILPDSVEQGLEYGVTEAEYSSREKTFNTVLTVLIENQLVAESNNREHLDSSLIAGVAQTDGVDVLSDDDDVAAQKRADIARTFEERINSEFTKKEQKVKSRRYQQIEDLAIDTRLEEALVKNAPSQASLKKKPVKKTLPKDAGSSGEKKPGVDTFSSDSVASDVSSKNYSLARSPRVEKNYEITQSPLESTSELEAVIAEREVIQSSSVSSAPALLESSGLQVQNRLEEDSHKPEKNNVTVFESEIDPFAVNLLDSGHLVMYRKVWKNEQRFIQGILIDPTRFLEKSIGALFQSTQLSKQTDLVVAYNKNVLSLFSNERSNDSLAIKTYSQSFSGERLLQANLIDPFNDLQLLFSVNNLDAGPGSKVVMWSSLVMGLVLSLGVWLMYLLGVRQLRLVQQQQDFVSAVSHELKTPLTSIRMYGELLKEGWATEEKKKEYYHYIFDESERLSRLISNVLQLAKMNRGEWDVKLKEIPISSFVDNVRSKLNDQVTRSGFNLEIAVASDLAEKSLLADVDYLLQIMINLVDNAIKFSRNSDQKTVILSVSCKAISVDHQVALISVRDFGPGIEKSQRKKIFELFYRSEDELTRETVGTGIGLALVGQLVEAMKGSVTVSNKNSGAEFILEIPLAC
ncbi:MAG: HAMP domain-containing histidine kinase [Cellvibrionaceae bacterium]